MYSGFTLGALVTGPSGFTISMTRANISSTVHVGLPRMQVRDTESLTLSVIAKCIS